tara:strand:- start:599 stop:862 length:264 start_codon:yes stop_codon:yes gene_type:complete
MDLISDDITANDMMLQTPDTVHFYLRGAIERIDDSLGEGYAKEHPELLAGFIQACATELHTAIETKEISDALVEIAKELGGLREVMG